MYLQNLTLKRCAWKFKSSYNYYLWFFRVVPTEFSNTGLSILKVLFSPNCAIFFDLSLYKMHLYRSISTHFLRSKILIDYFSLYFRFFFISQTAFVFSWVFMPFFRFSSDQRFWSDVYLIKNCQIAKVFKKIIHHLDLISVPNKLHKQFYLCLLT